LNDLLKIMKEKYKEHKDYKEIIESVEEWNSFEIYTLLKRFFDKNDLNDQQIGVRIIKERLINRSISWVLEQRFLAFFISNLSLDEKNELLRDIYNSTRGDEYLLDEYIDIEGTVDTSFEDYIDFSFFKNQIQKVIDEYPNEIKERTYKFILLLDIAKLIRNFNLELDWAKDLCIQALDMTDEEEDKIDILEVIKYELKDSDLSKFVIEKYNLKRTTQVTVLGKKSYIYTEKLNLNEFKDNKKLYEYLKDFESIHTFSLGGLKGNSFEFKIEDNDKEVNYKKEEDVESIYYKMTENEILFSKIDTSMDDNCKMMIDISKPLVLKTLNLGNYELILSFYQDEMELLPNCNSNSADDAKSELGIFKGTSQNLKTINRWELMDKYEDDEKYLEELTRIVSEVIFN